MSLVLLVGVCLGSSCTTAVGSLQIVNCESDSPLPDICNLQLFSFPRSVIAESATPSFLSRLWRVVSLRDYNTRVVLLGTTILGITAGIVGTFMLLRKRALVGDVVGHSALPGIAIAFLVMEGFSPGSGKWLPGLLLGAFAFGLAGAVSVMLIDKYSRIKADAAMAMTLSVFLRTGGGFVYDRPASAGWECGRSQDLSQWQDGLTHCG